MTDANNPAPREFRRRGLMFVLSSPSGAGKTTISRKLLAAEQNLRMSVSVTTRPMRPGEVDGKDYIFSDRAGFEQRVAQDGFLEWAEVFGNHYGTPRAEIEAGLEAGQDFLFDIDWQGTQQLYQRAEKDVVRVFLLPPSIAALESRLRNRGTDSAEVIAGRMARARSEISHWDGYDYVVVNDDIEGCFAKVRIILEAERLRRSRQTGLVDFVRGLVS
ncbi:MAG: guanylate kinase [Novosphingobium sp.]|jgi:guanylate kinase